MIIFNMASNMSCNTLGTDLAIDFVSDMSDSESTELELETESLSSTQLSSTATQQLSTTNIIGEISNNNISYIKSLIDSGVDINTQYKFGWTALSIAIICGSYDIAGMLLDAGADVTVKDDVGKTALFYAAGTPFEEPVNTNCQFDLYDAIAHRDTTSALRLIPLVKNVDYCDDGGYTLLMHACKNNLVSVVTGLIDAGADININNGHGTALFQSAIRGYDKILKLLIDAGGKIHEPVKFNNGVVINLLSMAVLKGHLSCVKTLIDAGMDIDTTTILNTLTDNIVTPLEIAIYKGHFDIVKYLVKKSAKIGLETFRQAICTENAKILGFLIDNQPSVNLKANFMTLISISKSDNCKLFDFLTSHQDSLIYCVINDKLNTVIELIRQGVDINKPDYLGNTMLTYAIDYNLVGMTKLLVDNGVTYDMSFNNTLIDVVSSNKLDILKILVADYINVDCRDPETGKTLLMIACKNQYVDMVKVLLDAGANIYAVDNDCLAVTDYNMTDEIRQTFRDVIIDHFYSSLCNPVIQDLCKKDKIDALLLALVKRNDIYRIKLFLETYSCINHINCVDSNGHTLLHLAIQYNYVRLARYLIRSGANVNTISKKRSTPLYSAVYIGNYRLVKLLVTKGANVKFNPGNSSTMLMHAAYNRNLNIVQLLIKYGANVNIRFRGRTALSYALMTNKKRGMLIKILRDEMERTKCERAESKSTVKVETIGYNEYNGYVGNVGHAEYICDKNNTTEYVCDENDTTEYLCDECIAAKYVCDENDTEYLCDECFAAETNCDECFAAEYVSTEYISAETTYGENNTNCDEHIGCFDIRNKNVVSKSNCDNINTSEKYSQTKFLLRCVCKKTTTEPNYVTALVLSPKSKAKIWHNGWHEVDFDSRNIEIQLVTDAGRKIEYHVLPGFPNESDETFIKLPTDLPIIINGTELKLYDVYRVSYKNTDVQ